MPAREGATNSDAFHRNQEPQFFWPAYDGGGRLLGHLCVHTFANDADSVSFLAFQKKGFGRERWALRRARGLELVIAQHQLKNHPDAILVFAGDATSLDFAARHMDRLAIHILAELRFGAPDRVIEQISVRSNPMKAAAAEGSASAVVGKTSGDAPARLPQKPVCATAPDVHDAGPCPTVPTAAIACARAVAKTEASLVREELPVPDLHGADVLSLRPRQALRASELPMTPVAWAWQNRIPLGHVTLIAGDPGLGKSALTAYLAARISRGDALPDGDRCAPRGQVLLVSAEDNAEGTIVPRLRAAGADLAAVHLLREPPNLVHDFPSFKQEAIAIDNLKLIVVDPVTACMGGTDPNRTGPARVLMTNLSRLAARLECAVVGVSHLSKASGMRNPLAAVAGSNAFGAAARMAYLVSADTEDANRCLLLPFKNNLGPRATGLAFHKRNTRLANGIKSPVVEFDGTVVEITAAEALRAAALPTEERSALAQAKTFLIGLLKEGPLAANVVKEQARSAGIAHGTLVRAKSMLGIHPAKTAMEGGWVWALPEPKMLNPTEDAHPRSLRIFDENEHLRPLARPSATHGEPD